MSEDNDLPEFVRYQMQSGRNADGTFTVNIKMVVSVEDEIALRASHLIDPNDDVPSDWGVENAINQVVTDQMMHANWAPLRRGETRITTAPAGATIPPA